MSTAARGSGREREAGFSLVEMVAVGAMLAALAAILVNLMAAGRDGSRVVMQQTSTSEDLRRVTDRLVVDLAQSTAGRITVANLADGNNSLTLQVPIDVVAGAVVWGVNEPSLGPDAATRERAGWSIRYTVEAVGSGATLERNLVRQLVDDAAVVRREEIVARRLQSGLGSQPGFRVVANGDARTVTVSAVPTREGERGNSATFDVWPRN